MISVIARSSRADVPFANVVAEFFSAVTARQGCIVSGAGYRLDRAVFPEGHFDINFVCANYSIPRISYD